MSSKSLNPKAKLFLPMSVHQQTTQPKLLHPHHIISNSTESTVVQTVHLTVSQPQLTYYYPIFHWTSPQPLYHHQYSPDKVFPAVEECFYNPFSGGKAAMNKFKGHTGKRPKCPSLGFNTCLPPRMERVFSSFPVNEKPKKVWRPVSKANSNTTVMIRNIPNQLRREFMLNCLDSCCRDYSLEYDFFYLPMDFRRGDNLGYAFVNFTSAAAASTFITVFDGFKWVGLNTDEGPIISKKICRIKWARIQGKDSLVSRFQRSSFKCNSLEFLPVLLDPPRNGKNANPPPPVIVGQLHLCPDD